MDPDWPQEERGHPSLPRGTGRQPRTRHAQGLPQSGEGGATADRPTALGPPCRLHGKATQHGSATPRSELQGPRSRARSLDLALGASANFIRTVPVLLHDPDRPENLDTTAENHAGDEARYECVSRPGTAPASTSAEKRRDWWDAAESSEATWQTV